MRLIRTTSAAVLTLLLGFAVPVYAQKDHDGEKQGHEDKAQGKEKNAKPQQQHAQQQQHTQDRSAQTQRAERAPRQTQTNQQQRAQQQRTDRAQPAPQRAQRQTQNNQQQNVRQQRSNANPQRNQQANAWQQHRSQKWDSDHRNWQQRGGYNGYRVPQDRYNTYFGSNHGFRIYGQPFMVVGGYPRFQYGGYWISLVDPWPDYWGNNWYDDDDVYVDYRNDGYYLYNRRHPGVGISISISL